jgi:hypothetical protein
LACGTWEKSPLKACVSSTSTKGTTATIPIGKADYLPLNGHLARKAGLNRLQLLHLGGGFLRPLGQRGLHDGRGLAHNARRFGVGGHIGHNQLSRCLPVEDNSVALLGPGLTHQN